MRSKTQRQGLARFGPVVLAAMMFVGVTACGDDSSDESVEDTVENEVVGETPGGEEVTLSVTATDFAFDPVDPVVFAGDSTVHLINEGSQPHTWVLLQQGVSAEQYIDSIDSATTTAELRDVEEDQTLAKVQPALASLADPVTFTIDEAGTYTVICDIPEHFEKGMQGTLVVE
jgi:plastocyanin